jgi:hypothetical protein
MRGAPLDFTKSATERIYQASDAVYRTVNTFRFYNTFVEAGRKACVGLMRIIKRRRQSM